MNAKIFFPALLIIMIVTSIALIDNKQIPQNDLFSQNLEALTNGEHEQNLVSCYLKVEWVKDVKSENVLYCAGCYSAPATSYSNKNQCIKFN